MTSTLVALDNLPTLVSALPDLIALLDVNGNLLQILPTRRQNQIGTDPQQFSLPAYFAESARMMDAIARAQRQNEIVHVEMKHATLDSWYSVMFSPMTDGTILLSARDMTERKENEDRLQRAHDELLQRVASSMQEVSRINTQLTAKVRELEDYNQAVIVLGEMGAQLQACVTPQEAYKIIARDLPRLISGSGGALSIISNSRDIVEAELTWGRDTNVITPLFEPKDCWALRSGRVHDSTNLPICNHWTIPKGDPMPNGCACIPMVAAGETLGVLSIYTQEPFDDLQRKLLGAATEQIALALANLRLRQLLNDLSIRDALTGLFNRRYMEESIGRELARARRSGERIGFLMIDTDFFKKFNDTYGHETGDAVLRELGGMFRAQLRAHDIPCRYAGDEWLMILVGKELDLENATRRAEELRILATRLRVQSGGQLIGNITLSIGVSLFPDHGEDKDAILKAADRALYRAKEAGRNRVEIAMPEALAMLGVQVARLHEAIKGAS
jgi:diguanylate cyclase (GGDEF)-like protein